MRPQISSITKLIFLIGSELWDPFPPPGQGFYADRPSLRIYFNLIILKTLTIIAPPCPR